MNSTTTTTTPIPLDSNPRFEVGWPISGPGILPGTVIIKIRNRETTTTPAPPTPTPEPTLNGLVADISFGIAAGTYCLAGTFGGANYYLSDNGYMIYFDTDAAAWVLGLADNTIIPSLSTDRIISVSGNFLVTHSDENLVISQDAPVVDSISWTNNSFSGVNPPLTGWYGGDLAGLALTVGECQGTTTTPAPIPKHVENGRVEEKIVINSQPQSINLGYGICGGKPEIYYTFTVDASLLSGNKRLYYQWQYKNEKSQWINFTDETKATGIYTPSLTTKCGDTGLPYLSIKNPFRVIISAEGVESIASEEVQFFYYEI